MGITRTIGKNTLGDNNKMKVRLREYDMSSQNLSYVFRSTIGVGMLVPFMKILCQKGDIFDIKLTNKTMTHPTLGPLFGSFKLQHFIFTAGFRLYNSWLHNNRTGIGMKMSDIKLPITSNYFSGNNTTEKNNPSSLYAYLGWKGSKRKNTSSVALKQSVPLLIYLDIFKNYFANTQEDNFYIITGSTKATVTFEQQNEDTFCISRSCYYFVEFYHLAHAALEYWSFWSVKVSSCCIYGLQPISVCTSGYCDSVQHVVYFLLQVKCIHCNRTVFIRF